MKRGETEKKKLGSSLGLPLTVFMTSHCYTSCMRQAILKCVRYAFLYVCYHQQEKL